MLGLFVDVVCFALIWVIMLFLVRWTICVVCIVYGELDELRQDGQDRKDIEDRENAIDVPFEVEG